MNVRRRARREVLTENSAVSCIYCYYSQHKPRSPQLRTTRQPRSIAARWRCCLRVVRGFSTQSRVRRLSLTAVKPFVSAREAMATPRGSPPCSDGDRALTHLDDTSMTRGTCPQATSHSLCGGGVPSSHPRPLGLGFAVFFLFFPVLLLIWRVRVINYLEGREGALMSVRT